jgi:hypothetical protein
MGDEASGQFMLSNLKRSPQQLKLSNVVRHLSLLLLMEAGGFSGERPCCEAPNA